MAALYNAGACAAAGKHFYCEWLLGVDIAEAEEMRYEFHISRSAI